jgi:two-component system, NarL family, sensor histidine kinase UhpB
MRQSFFLISVLFQCGVLSNTAQAQNQRLIDSLTTLLETSKEDTNKVNYLNELAWELMYLNPDTAIVLGNQSLALSEKLEWKKGQASSIGRLGVYYWNKSDYSKALEYDFIALKMNEELGIKDRMAGNLSNIGIIYDKQGDRTKALEYYLRALKINEELGKKLAVATNLANIGVLYKAQREYPKALEYYNRALKLSEELGDKGLIATNLHNIGNIYRDQSDYESALDCYLKSLKIREEIGSKKGVASSIGTIGLLYSLTGRYKEAEVNLKKAIAMVTPMDLKKEMRDFEFSLSQLYDTTAQEAVKKGQFKLAAENFKLSLIHYKKAIAVKDTLFNLEKSKEITRNEMNYEFDKKEVATKAEHDKQMAVADVEIQRQKLLKNFFIGGLVLLFMLSYFIYNNFRTASKLKLQNIRNKIASDLHDDVGSTLNSISIYSEVAKQKSPAMVHELEQIGDASRKIIEVMSDIVWTINPKNDTFENIIDRMSSIAYNLLKAKNIEHSFRADEGLNELKLSLESRRNFYLIFKEALNNLVKYSKATRASISLTNENGLIKLSIRDNGVGFDVLQTSRGNGLLNMKNRAEEMKAQLKIESEKGNGAHIELTFKA